MSKMIEEFNLEDKKKNHHQTHKTHTHAQIYAQFE